jgi:hypothetical protein
MKKHKRIARITYKHIGAVTDSLRPYMVLILPPTFNPQETCSLKVEGGLNLAGDFTTFVGYNSACTIEKPTLKDYLELSLAMKYRYDYKSEYRKRRGY